MGVAISLMEVCGVSLGTPGVSLDRIFASRRTESSNSNISRSSLTTTTSYVSRRYMEGTSISRLFRCWLHELSFLVLYHSWKRKCRRIGILHSQGYSSRRCYCDTFDYLSRQSSYCEHTVWATKSSGCQRPFEPELTLRHLRGRLHLINPHWLSYLNAVVIILGDFNICDPEERRFHVWNQTFTDGDPRKIATLHSFFPHVLEIAQPDFTRRDSTALGIIRTLSRIDRIFIDPTMAEARDFHCYSHVFENLGNRTIPSDHEAVRLVIHMPNTREQSCKRIPCWMSKHPVFCSMLKRLHDNRRFSADPFGALAEFKVVLEKAKKLTIPGLSRKTLAASEQSSQSPLLQCVHTGTDTLDAHAML